MLSAGRSTQEERVVVRLGDVHEFDVLGATVRRRFGGKVQMIAGTRERNQVLALDQFCDRVVTGLDRRFVEDELVMVCHDREGVTGTTVGKV